MTVISFNNKFHWTSYQKGCISQAIIVLLKKCKWLNEKIGDTIRVIKPAHSDKEMMETWFNIQGKDKKTYHCYCDIIVYEATHCGLKGISKHTLYHVVRFSEKKDSGVFEEWEV